MSGEIKFNYSFRLRCRYWLSISVARILVKILVLRSILKVEVDARPNPQEDTYEIAQSIHLPQLSQYLQSQDVLHPQQLRNSEASVSGKAGLPLTYTVFPAILANNQKNPYRISTLNQVSRVPSTKEAAIDDSIYRSYANYPTQSDYSIESAPISSTSELESGYSPHAIPLSSIPRHESGYSIPTPAANIPQPDSSRSGVSQPIADMEQFKALRIPITLIKPSEKFEFLQYARAKQLDMEMVQRFLRTLVGNIDKSHEDLLKSTYTPNIQTNAGQEQPQPQPQPQNNNGDGYSEGQNFQTSALFSELENFQANGYSPIQNYESNIPFSEQLTQRENIQAVASPPSRQNSQPDIVRQIQNQLLVSEQLPILRGLPELSKSSQSQILSPKPQSGNKIKSIQSPKLLIPRIEIEAPPLQQPPPKNLAKAQQNILTPPHVQAKPQIELQVPAHPEPPRELQVPSKEQSFLNHVANSIKNMILISERREAKKPQPRPGGTKIIGLTAPKKQTPTESSSKTVDLKNAIGSRIVNRPVQNRGVTSSPVSNPAIDSNFQVYVLSADDKTESPNSQGGQGEENLDPNSQFQTPQELTNGRGPTVPPVQIVESLPESVTPSVNTLYSVPENNEPPQELPNGRGPIGQQNPQNVRGLTVQNIGTIGNVVTPKPDVFHLGNPIGVLQPGGNLFKLTPFVFTPSTESTDGTNRVETISSSTPSEFQNQESSAESDKEGRTLSVTLPNSATGFLYIQVGPNLPQSFVPAVPPVIPGFLTPSPSPPGTPAQNSNANVQSAAPAPENKSSPPPAQAQIPQNENRQEVPPSSQYDDNSSTYFGGQEVQLIPPTVTDNLRRPFFVSTPANGAVELNCNINGRSIPCGTVRSVQRTRTDDRNGRNRVIIPGNISKPSQIPQNANVPEGLPENFIQASFTPENGVNELEIITNKPDTTTGSDIEVAQLDCLIRPAGLTRIPCATIKSVPRRPGNNPSGTDSNRPTFTTQNSNKFKVDCAVNPGLGLSRIPCATVTSVDRATLFKPPTSILLDYPSIFPASTSSTEKSRFRQFDTLTSESIQSSTISEETPETGISPVVESTIPVSTSGEISSTKVEEINSGSTIPVSEKVEPLTAKPVDVTEKNLEVVTGSTILSAPETEGTSTSTVPSESSSANTTQSETGSTTTTTVPPVTGSTNVVPSETGTSSILPEEQLPNETVITAKDTRSTPVDSNEYATQLDCYVKEYMFQIPCATSIA